MPGLVGCPEGFANALKALTIAVDPGTHPLRVYGYRRWVVRFAGVRDAGRAHYSVGEVLTNRIILAGKDNFGYTRIVDERGKRGTILVGKYLEPESLRVRRSGLPHVLKETVRRENATDQCKPFRVSSGGIETDIMAHKQFAVTVYVWVLIELVHKKCAASAIR